MQFAHQGHSLLSLMKLGRGGMFQGLLKGLYVLGMATDGLGTMILFGVFSFFLIVRRLWYTIEKCRSAEMPYVSL